MTKRISKPTKRDIYNLIDNLRLADQVELSLMHPGRDFFDVIYHSIKTSEVSQSIYIDGKIVCIFGVCKPSILSTDCCPWLLASNAIYMPKVRMLFIRHSKKMQHVLTYDYNSAYNYVWSDNKLALRWLRWLGFRNNGHHYFSGAKFIKMQKDLK